ncbi:MAG: F0F1 ATP synthase subunit A [Alphaproteobacteria bacterium]|nr:F0F1 ATP synthase subunit A [Alphaproteobacteria bacterium]
MASLFDEFVIRPIGEPLFSLGGHPVAFTNSALFMFISVALCTWLMVAAMRPQAVVPGRWQMIVEKLYDLVTGMLESGAGEKAKPFFPLIFTIFIYIFFCNLTGLLPWALPVTAHVIVNLGIALILFLIIVVTGFVRHGTHFLSLFVPRGAPMAVMPVMIFIEVFSFSVRPFSLSIRLFGNMLAGHLVLGVFAGFIATLLTAGWLAGFSVLPLFADVAVFAFEFFVAFLQAYIYAVLASVYLHDAIEMH